MKNLTAIMISFMRPEYTKECIRSLKAEYPDIKVLVGENDKYNEDLYNFVKKHGGDYFVLPFDSGVCIARNRLMEFVDTEFVMVGDDDFYYDKNAKVDKMLQFLEGRKEFSVVGGRINEHGKVLNYQGFIHISPDHFVYENLDLEKMLYDHNSGMTYQKCDITFNYFVARTEDIRPIKWDEQIKVAFEHSDWFISLKKAGIPVAYTPDAVVVHKPDHVVIERNEKYVSFRNRRSDEKRFFDKHGIKYSIGFKGTKYKRRTPKEMTGMYYAKRKMTYDGKTYNVGDIIYTTMPADGMAPCF